MRHLAWLALLTCVACNGETKDGPESGDTGDTNTDTDTDGPTGDDPVDGDGDGFGADVDCDDGDSAVYPGAPDLCGDDRVTDCDRTSDQGLITLDGTTGFDSLADALAAASSGSELLLCPGAYEGPLTANVPVRLRAHGAPEETTLLGTQGSVLSVPGGSEIVGLTVQGGKETERGGGIRMTSAGTLLVEGCVVTGNEASFGGGISVAPGAQAVLVGTEVRDNDATEGGAGIEVGAGGSLTLGEGTIVAGNTARWFGGGVWLDGASLTGGSVSGNTVNRELVELFEDYLYYAYYYGGVAPLPSVAVGGGGVAMTGSSSVTSTEIAENGGDGAGISVIGGEASLVDVSVHDNEGQLAGGLLAAGAAISLQGSTELSGNQAVWGGGAALYSSSVSGGSLRDNTASDNGGGAWLVESSLEGTTVSGNHSFDGGGIYSMAHVTLTGVLLQGNDAWDGGAVSTTTALNDASEHQLTLVDCTLQGNLADDGGAIFAYSNVSLVDTVVSDNIADDLGGGIRLYVPVSDGYYGEYSSEIEPTVTITGGALIRNTAATEGGGAQLSAGVLVVEGADLGAGADDNLPGDIVAGGLAVGGYGADATFTCDGSGCTPIP